jgi:hypothetical protein
MSQKIYMMIPPTRNNNLLSSHVNNVNLSNINGYYNYYIYNE